MFFVVSTNLLIFGTKLPMAMIPFFSYRDASTRLVDTGLSCVAFALLIGDYMAKSDAGIDETGLMWI